jgi:hypothetical protein
MRPIPILLLFLASLTSACAQLDSLDQVLKLSKSDQQRLEFYAGVGARLSEAETRALIMASL